MEESEVKKNKKGEKMKWRWVIAAFTTVLIAIALASRSTPMISFKFGHTFSKSSCQCPQEHRYSGIVEDCCCDYETVDHLNEEVLHPLLQELVKTPFFRYFKVKLWCNCPFWPDDDDLKCQEGKPEATVDRTLDSQAFRGWTETDNPWTYDDETDNSEMTYVNLQLNPERYTGYTGPSARRIWDAVYSENCPKYPAEELCQEEKILYKLISGLHSSISIHIGSDYLLDEATNLWGHNLDLLYNRVLRYPNRVQNLYFTFLFVLRAVTKATNYLEQAEYNTGNPTEDLKTQSLMRQLLYNPKLRAACPLPFNEARLWKGQRGPELKQKIQAQFKNISALMDCVGCEKCRLWGKLQVLGLGTALKILFSVNGEEHLHQRLELQRNEVIALMNLLNRLSESLKFVHEMGVAAEKLNEGTRISPIRLFSLVQRMWAPIVKT
ncbi:endoplasmic reticulum oxidoreductin-2-like isoform X2 [Hibiscus syriacus]|uniref:endoplasmic reticulum oxidoreductin-2-like isoform X2 n=1 Tax=Hibiscus syriacus TaxID=106335 RepID=UPI00192215AE|nr:endoplasmic reticulum oxidoreductin-2-like isoform X2 [Hibiscus syriacus]